MCCKTTLSFVYVTCPYIASGGYWQVLLEMWDKVHIQDMVTSCIILYNMMVQQQLEVGEECTGDYFKEGLPQDHDNDDGNSNVADEAEDLCQYVGGGVVVM